MAQRTLSTVCFGPDLTYLWASCWFPKDFSVLLSLMGAYMVQYMLCIVLSGETLKIPLQFSAIEN